MWTLSNIMSRKIFIINWIIKNQCIIKHSCFRWSISPVLQQSTVSRLFIVLSATLLSNFLISFYFSIRSCEQLIFIDAYDASMIAYLENIRSRPPYVFSRCFWSSWWWIGLDFMVIGGSMFRERWVLVISGNWSIYLLLPVPFFIKPYRAMVWQISRWHNYRH